MQFISYAFIIFWLVCLLLYYLFPQRFKWTVLLIASLVFYLWAVKAVPYGMLLTGVSTYLCGLYLNSSLEKEKRAVSECQDKDERKIIKTKYANTRKLFQTIYIIFNLGLLITYKYSSLLMPLGISFYTLTAIGYVVDAGRENCKVEINPGKLLLFLFYFPAITQGPFNRFSELNKQFEKDKSYDFDKVMRGVKRFVWGIFKKLVIADRMGIFVDAVYASDMSETSGSIVILATAFYMLQLYADFSGYIDMAIGVSETFDIELPENFRRPFFSKSVGEFWRRWHISLGLWFKDYVMYSFVMSSIGRKLGKKCKKVFNNVGKNIVPIIGTMLVWIMTGAWHGKTVNYMLWGVYYGVIMSVSLCMEKRFEAWKTRLNIGQGKIYSAFCMLRTWGIVFIADALIRCNTLAESGAVFKAMITHLNPLAVVSHELTDYGLNRYDFIKLIVALGLLLVVSIVEERNKDIRDYLLTKPLVARSICYYLIIMLILIVGIYGGGYDTSAFMYQSF